MSRPSARAGVYVFPTIGTIDELSEAEFDLLGNLRFLDLTNVPSDIDPPRKLSGEPRKNGLHGFYLSSDQKTLTIKSDPVEVDVIEILELASRIRQRSVALEVNQAGYSAPGDSDSELTVGDVSSFLKEGSNRMAVFVVDA